MSFSIPADVAEHVQKVADVLHQHKARLDRLYEVWADEDPDPENGDFWHLQIAHPEADQMRRNMEDAAKFLTWLANFKDGGGK